jgi:hypothetical protein
MKKTGLLLAALAISTGILFSFDNAPTNTIRGTVSPADKAIRVWALSFNDTLIAEVENGSFEIKGVQPDTYAIVVEAKAPFANIRKRDVVVGFNSAVTDVGEIALHEKPVN